MHTRDQNLQSKTLGRLQGLALDRAKELHFFAPDIPIAIATHNVTEEIMAWFDYVIIIPPRNIFKGARERSPGYWPQWRTRILYYGSSPFENTLAFDADFRVTSSPLSLFNRFTDYDFVIKERYNFKSRTCNVHEFGLIGGVLLYKKNEEIFNKWWQFQMKFHFYKLEDDQDNLKRALLYFKNIKIGCFTAEAAAMAFHLDGVNWPTTHSSVTPIFGKGVVPILAHMHEYHIRQLVKHRNDIFALYLNKTIILGKIIDSESDYNTFTRMKIQPGDWSFDDPPPSKVFINLNLCIKPT